jgi:tRNA-splicing ligase RtcB (3'-phosphate/5'-hydroxy nucleic acid ligase)
MHKIGEKIASWIEPGAIEPEALLQLERTARLPFVERHVAVMPDCHVGIGATVGSVIATDGAIIPAAVGVDIGCGMIAVRTNLGAADLPDSLAGLRARIERTIPTGVGQRGRNRHLTPGARTRVDALARDAGGGPAREYGDLESSWPEQLGSLGGGNHFIEVSLDADNRVWLVLHSGSRGIGNRLATRHIKTARKLLAARHLQLEDPDLAELQEGTPEFDAYMRDLHWSQEFARHNRDEMMDRLVTALREEVPHAAEVDRINCHHNFTQREEHFGRDLWITRKGAIQMKKGQRGVIPGSMGTRSYVVSGLGNRESFESAPHGAGRRMSRGEARKRFTMEDLEKRMEGIESRLRPSILDEHPDSYKDIDEVMERSRDLVQIEHVLRQVLNVKGD